MTEDKKKKVEEINKKEKVEEIKMEDPRPVELEVPALEEKPKRRRKKKEKEDHSELEQNLSIIIRTIFDMLATRDPVWKLADTEVEAVAKPGARILTRLGAEEETNKNADYLLLIIGIAGIIIPRVMVIKTRRQVRPVEPRSQGEAGTGGPEASRSSSGSDTGNVKILLPGLA